ncbi:hypothetical protein ATCC90586_004303 [Pythium insidiosum]|nr:hypothetical protein ATCC90586_004303 [Pythium insidiosum]
MDTRERPNGYFRQYLARMPPPPPPPPPLPLPATAPVLPLRSLVPGDARGCKAAAHSARRAASLQRKTLVDAFKQHGMKLCDGTKLHAVAKRLTHLGVVPPTLGTHVISLYLSQNELRTLEGIEQFRSLRLLSLGGNRLERFTELQRLATLPHLRQLNLSGNPLCELPNYRLRVIDVLERLTVLDAREISPAERDVAALVASQDKALRELVLRQHMTIHKLQRVVVWIQVLHEFRAVVVRSAASGRFDQLCSMPNDSLALDVERFLGAWRDDGVFSSAERAELETQMLSIVARAQATLAVHPRAKAKALLLELAGHRAVRLSPSHTPSELRQQCAEWEDAYASVLQLQQETIVRLQSQCERHNRAMCDALRELLVLEPQARHAVRCWPRAEVDPRVRRSPRAQRMPTAAVTNRAIENKPAAQSQPVPQSQPQTQSPPQLQQRPTPSPGALNRRPLPQLRCGEFGGNKTLHEAVEAFTLRSSTAAPSRRTTQQRGRQSTGPVPLPTTRRVVASALRQSSADPEQSVQVSRVHEYRQLGQRVAKREHVRDDGDDDATSLSGTRDLESETVGSVNTNYYAASLGSWAEMPRRRSFQAISLSDWQSRGLAEATGAAQIEPEEDEDEEKEQEEQRQKQKQEEDSLEPGSERAELKRRQQELEDREERYLKALMAGEQRELELRQQLHSVEQQLSEYRASLAQDDAERRRIKREVACRVAAIAAPIIRRRCFARWRRHARVLVRRRALAQQRQHFIEWLNVTRICVIARHSQALREAQLLQRVLREWQRYADLRRQQALIWLHALSLPQRRQRRRVLSAVWRAWRLHVRRRRLFESLQRRHQRHALDAWMRLVLAQWRWYVGLVVRPWRLRVEAWTSERRRQRSARCFSAWWRLARARRLHKRHVLRRRWTSWRLHVCLRRSHDAESLARRLQALRWHLVAWRETAAKRSRRRRAGTVVRRVVTHRRLRKLWMHWKLYALARRRYVQGVTKAVRHYWRKLLRRLWAQWRESSRANAASRHERSRSELARHFHALQAAVATSKALRRQELLVAQLHRRRARQRLQTAVLAWRRHAQIERRRRAQAARLHQRVQRRWLRDAWSRWSTLRWREAVGKWRGRCAAASASHAELEAALNDREDSSGKLRQSLAHARREIASQRDELSQRRRQQEEDAALVRHLEQRCRDAGEREQQQALALAELQQQWDDERAQRARFETEREAETRSMTQRLEETQTALAEAQRQAAVLAERERRLEEELESQRRVAKDAEKRWEARVAGLQNALDDAERRLGEARREREDTANRLQDYERRLATTCVEMQAHEQAVEDEVALLRAENARLSAHRRDADARGEELERLLHEKNAQLVELTMRLEQRERERERERQDTESERYKATASTAMQTDDAGPSPTPKPTTTTPSTRQEPDDNRALLALVTLPPSAEERRLEEHTSRLHADLRLLQERISQRLALAPCVPSVTDVLASRSQRYPRLCLPEQDSSVEGDKDEDEMETDSRRHPRSPERALIPAHKAARGAKENLARMANRRRQRATPSEPLRPAPPSHPQPSRARRSTPAPRPMEAKRARVKPS